ncbi:Anthranilate synthase, aminase component [hydrothermal vent metagenome]|uniref:Anthranilate synthase component 1 n=1 Tax=hydrothermal vent metagenome TaxID=652676 RepID=A0A3B0QTV2_9ZZZZ
MESSKYFPTLAQFREEAKTNNIIPVFRDILADTDTPVSAFMKIDDGGESFLLESVEFGDKWGRYSFLGSSAKAVIRAKDGRVTIAEGGEVTERTGDPLAILSDYLGGFSMATLPGVEGLKFAGGVIGYMGYDIVRYIEKIARNPKHEARTDELKVDDYCFIRTDTLLAFDNVSHSIKVICSAHVPDGADPEAVYNEAIEKINHLVAKLRAPAPVRINHGAEHLPVTSNYEKEDFKAGVVRIKEYIEAGDVIQTVLAQRFETEQNVESFDIYRALRVTNPSPYMFFLRMAGIELAGSSPEILVALNDGEVTVRPIAGTRPRGKDAQSDKVFEDELLADPKELAEHIMLVDLGRNDVGKVAKPGSVEVDQFMVIERYSHVMHIVSNVMGQKLDGLSSFDVLSSCFPAGTLTGAAKVRSMEIIEELEPDGRTTYGGCVGYFDYSGNMDTCITIRTVLAKDGRLYVQAGAGIVADSDPEREFEETVNKSKGVLKAVEMARDGFE